MKGERGRFGALPKKSAGRVVVGGGLLVGLAPNSGLS